MENINMFSDYIEYNGVKVFVDGFYKDKKLQNILPILYEEQPITWELLKNELFQYEKEFASVLDVGTGSGFWALLLKKTFPLHNVWAIDKNLNAIERAKENSALNNLDIKLNHTQYSFDNYNYQSQAL